MLALSLDILLLFFCSSNENSPIGKLHDVVIIQLFYRNMAAEDYPHEIDEQLTGFDSSVTSVKTILEQLMSMPRNDLLQKVGLILLYTSGTVVFLLA